MVADDELTVEDSWVLSRLNTVTQAVTDALADYRFADAARVLYDFAWDEFCSFYVEMVKGRLQGTVPIFVSAKMGLSPSMQDASEANRVVAQRVLAHVLDTLLRLLHPMIPFLDRGRVAAFGRDCAERGIDEASPAAESIMLAAWPECDPMRQDAEIEAQFARFQEVLRAVRDIRARQGVAPKTPLDVLRPLRCRGRRSARPMEPYFESMANAQATAIGPDVTAPALSANVSISGMEVFVDLAELIDKPAEIARKKQEVEKLVGFIASKEKKLTNASFVDRAPADVVQKERDSLKELQDQLAAAREVLERLETRNCRRPTAGGRAPRRPRAGRVVEIGGVIKSVIGKAKGLPPDAAQNVDRYLYDQLASSSRRKGCRRTWRPITMLIFIGDLGSEWPLPIASLFLPSCLLFYPP